MSPSKHLHFKFLFKHLCPGPLTKLAIYCSIVQACLNEDFYTQPFQPDMTKAENPTVEQFCLYYKNNLTV